MLTVLLQSSSAKSVAQLNLVSVFGCHFCSTVQQFLAGYINYGLNDIQVPSLPASSSLAMEKLGQIMIGDSSLASLESDSRRYMTTNSEAWLGKKMIDS